MTALLQITGWLMCVIYSTIPAYWLIIHPYTNYWRSRSRSPFRVLLPLWIASWIVIGAITAPFRHAVLYASPWTWIPAALLLLAGFWIYKQSGQQFTARQLGGLPEILPNHVDQRLVTSGIRARVRHPVYLAHMCEMLAWSVGTGLFVCYGLTAFAILTGATMVKVEDAELERRFGDQYRKYRQQVPGILPNLFKK
jgi:protein-S-isoprenylcysteine O-methyltransferase Ste14